MNAFSNTRGLRAALGRLLDDAQVVFCKLARIQFAEPWRDDRGRAC